MMDLQWFVKIDAIIFTNIKKKWFKNFICHIGWYACEIARYMTNEVYHNNLWDMY